jgi:hypothetical protein
VIPPETNDDPDRPTDEDRLHALQHDYADLIHAMQSGCEYGVGGMTGSPPVGPQAALDRWREQKHLRVGVNSVNVSIGALSKLLVAKGVITDLEYVQAVVDELRAYVGELEAEISQTFGIKVTLR